MAKPRPVTRLEFQETDTFVQELDRLVLRRHEIHVVVPTRPPDDSRLYVRIRRCDTATVASADPDVPAPAPPRPRQNIFARLFHIMYRKPNYFTYVAIVHKDLDPLEVHLIPH